MNRSRFTPDQVYALHREYTAGVTIRVLAQRNECGRETIRRAFAALGLTMRDNGLGNRGSSEWQQNYDVDEDAPYGLYVKFLLR